MKKQYCIGFNQRIEKVFDKLFDLGATLMFYWHPYTIKLNAEYEFYEGEWMFYSVDPNRRNRIDEITSFLGEIKDTIKDFEYEIIPIN